MADQWTATPQGAMGPLGAQDRPMFGNPALGRKLKGPKSKIMTIGLPVTLAVLVIGGVAMVMFGKTSQDPAATTTTVATQTTTTTLPAPMPVAAAAATPFSGPMAAPPTVTIPSNRERLAVNPPARAVTRHVAQARRVPAAASARDAAADVSAVVPVAPPQVVAPAPAPMVIDIPPPAPQVSTPPPQG